MNIAVLTGLQDKIDNVHADIGGHLILFSEKIDVHGQLLQNTVTSNQLQGFINHMAQFDLSHSGEAVRNSMMNDSTSPPFDQRPLQPPATIKYALFRSHRSMMLESCIARWLQQCDHARHY